MPRSQPIHEPDGPKARQRREHPQFAATEAAQLVRDAGLTSASRLQDTLDGIRHSLASVASCINLLVALELSRSTSAAFLARSTDVDLKAELASALRLWAATLLDEGSLIGGR